MPLKTFRDYTPGSAEHTLLHADWRRSRGKRPSATFGEILNPREALKAAAEAAPDFSCRKAHRAAKKRRDMACLFSHAAVFNPFNFPFPEPSDDDEDETSDLVGELADDEGEDAFTDE